MGRKEIWNGGEAQEGVGRGVAVSTRTQGAVRNRSEVRAQDRGRLGSPHKKGTRGRLWKGPQSEAGEQCWNAR